MISGIKPFLAKTMRLAATTSAGNLAASLTPTAMVLCAILTFKPALQSSQDYSISLLFKMELKEQQ
jgi:hypothetical protein